MLDVDFMGKQGGESLHAIFNKKKSSYKGMTVKGWSILLYEYLASMTSMTHIRRCLVASINLMLYKHPRHWKPVIAYLHSSLSPINSLVIKRLFVFPHI